MTKTPEMPADFAAIKSEIDAANLTPWSKARILSALSDMAWINPPAVDGSAIEAAADAIFQVRQGCKADKVVGHAPFDYWAAEAALAQVTPRLDLLTVIEHHITFSLETFGPGERLAGTLDHLRGELVEIEADPHDCEEWVDVILLAIQGAARHGHNAEAIAAKWLFKMAKNNARTWPDWRTADPDKAIEHIRGNKMKTDCVCGGSGMVSGLPGLVEYCPRCRPHERADAE
ncbi:dATP/dGTP pyrophosphohydrolase domain-containing protein [Roseobacter weihaiensis]|uniref:dATP/dGTP pyrophosphohydrolase domain-containing protein n=1 Tax=Roseobacter weihaiensis TaxID=2763262 RepID=UPI001D0A913C|nr:dATP/dGTP pyrophosphohydrolase domain-containing protein [Roseobacter sp. H9]